MKRLPVFLVALALSVSSLGAAESLKNTIAAYDGMTLGAYVRRLRLDWAAARLTASDEPLAALALAAGFVDQSHFTRTFKQHTGLTPDQYRQATRR